MPHESIFQFVYLDSTGFSAYELADDEKEWLISEDKRPEFWLQRRPMIGKFDGYVRRTDLPSDIEILPPRSNHSDRSHPLPFV
ncbi:MAG: hypothetical protein PSX80_08065 [bacterium]|nr:hypothetical protein [bacterium]